jgi:hypothetical protein
MEKHIFCILTGLFLSLSAFAQDFTLDGINYNVISDSSVEVTSRGSYTGDIIIPYSVDYLEREYIVTSMGDGAFSGCSELTSITLPEGLTSIGGSAFRNCRGLTSITLPDGLTSIGDGAFYYCNSLTSITLPDGLTSIGKETFYYCSSLTSISLPDGVTSIGKEAFCNCASLTSISLPDGVTSIGDGAFAGCQSLTSITLPDGVTSIGENAFNGCTKLTSITIPDGVTSIGAYAFRNCSSLTSISLPDGVTSIGDYAFNGCTKLTSITIPDGVTSIGNYAFASCQGLTSISLPDGLTSIGNNAFFNCYNIKGIVTFGDSLLSIGNEAFSGLQFDAIICKSETPPAITSSSFGYEPSLVIVPQSAISAYRSAAVWSQYNIISEKRVVVENLTEGALATTIITKGYGPLSSITHLTVSGVLNEVDFQSIKDNMKSLMEVDISNAVLTGNSLPDYAFSNNKILTKIVLPNTLEVIGEYAFSYCLNLTDAQIPSSVKTIRIRAFEECGQLSGELNLPEGLERIESLSFRGCKKLSGPLRIPSSVNYIGSFAFQDCSNLSGDLAIPVGIEAIEDYTFYYCSNLKGRLKIPSGVHSIGEGAFYNTGISGILSLPDSLNNLGRSAFSQCSGFTGALKIPVFIKSIPGYCFNECNNIQQLILPRALSSIEENAFLNCKSLNKIVLQSITPPTGPSNTFEGIPYDCHLSLPKNSAINYLITPLWGSFQKVSEIQREYQVMKGDTISLYGTTPFYPVENIRYVWEPGVGLSDSTVAYPVFKADTSQQYKLTVYSNETIYDVDSVFVKVTERGDSVSIQTLKINPIVKQSPSPFSTDFQLEITLSATAPINIQLMDIFGRIVHFEDLGVLNPGTHQRTIRASNWPAGVYLYQVRIGDGVYSGKIMKR